MTRSMTELKFKLTENLNFAQKMKEDRVLLSDYINFWYGENRGAKKQFAIDQNISSSQVTRWLKLQVYIENGRIKRPDPNPINLNIPNWIASFLKK